MTRQEQIKEVYKLLREAQSKIDQINFKNNSISELYITDARTAITKAVTDINLAASYEAEGN